MYSASRQRAIETDASEEPEEDGIFDVSFDLPPDADRRFSRFMKDYRIGSVLVKNDPANNVGEIELVEERDISSADVKDEGPGWRLICTCEAIW